MWGTGKEGRELKGFNGVKGKPGQKKEKCNKKQSMCAFTKRKENAQGTYLTQPIPYLPYNMTRVPNRHSHRGDNWEWQGGLSLPVRGTVTLPSLISLPLPLSGTAQTLHSTTEGP